MFTQLANNIMQQITVTNQTIAITLVLVTVYVLKQLIDKDDREIK